MGLMALFVYACAFVGLVGGGMLGYKSAKVNDESRITKRSSSVVMGTLVGMVVGMIALGVAGFLVLNIGVGILMQI